MRSTGIGATGRSRAAPRKRFFSSRRLRLAFWEWGEPEHEPILLVHGRRDHARSWDQIASRLSVHRRVIVPDLRGHGDSSWESDGAYATSGFVADIAELIARECPGPVDIVGHSFGGSISLQYSAAFPEFVRSIAVIEGAFGLPSGQMHWMSLPPIERLVHWINARREGNQRTNRLYTSVQEAADRLRERNSRWSKAQALHLARHGLRRTDDGHYIWKYDPLLIYWQPEYFSNVEVYDMWRAITCPVMLCYGSESWLPDPRTEGKLAYFRDIRLEIVSAGHWIHHEQPDWFLKTLSVFWRERCGD